MSPELLTRSPLYQSEQQLPPVTLVYPPTVWTPPPRRRWSSALATRPCWRRRVGGSASERPLLQPDGPKPTGAPTPPETRAPSLLAPARRRRTPASRRRTTPHSGRRRRRAFEGRQGDFRRACRRTRAGPKDDRVPRTRRRTPERTTHGSPRHAPADRGGRSRSPGRSARPARRTASSHEFVRRAAPPGSPARPKEEQPQPRCGVSNALV